MRYTPLKNQGMLAVPDPATPIRMPTIIPIPKKIAAAIPAIPSRFAAPVPACSLPRLLNIYISIQALQKKSCTLRISSINATLQISGNLPEKPDTGSFNPAKRESIFQPLFSLHETHDIIGDVIHPPYNTY
jgi:hypothetical protein